jgi:dipeptidyl aminopeptidase/acylaminoacyl peptidase
LIVIFSINGCTSNKPEVPLLPIKDFFKNPIKDSFRISPSGEKLAFLMPWENRMNIYIQEIGEDEKIRITSSTERDIKYFFWGNENKIIYLQDTNGDENYHLYAVDPDGSHHKELTPFQKANVWVIDELMDNESEMIIAMNKRNKSVFDAYRINVETGEIKLIAKNPGKVTKWFTDNNGVIRIAIETDGVNIGLLYRESEDDNFEPAILTDFKNELKPLFFTDDNKYVYASSNIGRDKCAIVKYDIKNNKELEVIYSHPEVDVWKLLRSKKRNKIAGVIYTTWKKHTHFFDEEAKQLQKNLEQSLPNLEVVISNSNLNEDKFIVRTYSDKNLGAFYYFDKVNNDLQKLSDVTPWLNEKNLAHMKPISYKTRDDLTIHGYLTLPRGVNHNNLPVVINPHGGPWIRDYWGFDREVQFLANRGYAVLQINYRGSTGYGKEFWQAGFKEWGQKMQNDIADGVHWLIRQEIAVPERIAIYGYSFGGYAALSGLIKNPELYSCAISQSGINDIFAFLNSVPPYWKPFREMLYEMVGDPVEDFKMMEENSPIFHAEKIKAPVFIAQGGNDTKVPAAGTEKFIKKLRENGVPVKYLFKEHEGHSFNNEENKIEFYTELEKFLAEHLRGRKSNLPLKN